MLLDTYALAPTIEALGTDRSRVAIVADVEAEVDSVSLNQVQHLVLPMAFARRMTRADGAGRDRERALE